MKHLKPLTFLVLAILTLPCRGQEKKDGLTPAPYVDTLSRRPLPFPPYLKNQSISIALQRINKRLEDSLREGKSDLTELRRQMAILDSALYYDDKSQRLDQMALLYDSMAVSCTSAYYAADDPKVKAGILQAVQTYYKMGSLLHLASQQANQQGQRFCNSLDTELINKLYLKSEEQD